jgi:predicted transcriptional regulator|tara:strand:- start:2271 stop:2837 length:567 start_codon:yes stop_codon:yes gene_type:complete
MRAQIQKQQAERKESFKFYFSYKDLEDIVSKVFDVDIHSKTRKRENVNARMSFAMILVKMGTTKVSIARYLGKDHATVLHYIKCFDNYFNSDKDLRKKHNQVLDVYNKKFNPIDELDRKTLIHEVSSLNKEISSLHCTIETYKEKLKHYSKEESRMDSIIKMVSQRTNHGKEKEIERKLNTWFNGIHN